MSGVYISPALRKQVSLTARHRCGYCLSAEAIVGASMEIDHILPLSLGGKTVEENLWLACSLCNDHKSDHIAAIDPILGELVRLFDPRRESWHDHFRWSATAAHILGITPTGRATVIALNLNRAILVRARQLWTIAGWHPPID